MSHFFFFFFTPKKNHFSKKVCGREYLAIYLRSLPQQMSHHDKIQRDILESCNYVRKKSAINLCQSWVTGSRRPGGDAPSPPARTATGAGCPTPPSGAQKQVGSPEGSGARPPPSSGPCYSRTFSCKPAKTHDREAPRHCRQQWHLESPALAFAVKQATPHAGRTATAPLDLPSF